MFPVISFLYIYLRIFVLKEIFSSIFSINHFILDFIWPFDLFQFLNTRQLITEKVKREINIGRYKLLVKYSRAGFDVSYILVSGQ